MPLTLADETPTARKEHWCQLCGRIIRLGETYHRQRNIGDDGPYVFKNCRHCEAILPLIDYDPGFGYTEDDYSQWEPTTLAELRWKVQLNRKWTRRDGALYPVPEP